MTKKNRKKQPVTSAELLDRLRTMEQRLVGHTGEVIARVLGEAREAECRLLELLERLESRMTSLRTGVGCLEANLTRQMDGIDGRLDAIELEKGAGRAAA